jgi:hypothetical protein
LRAVHAGVLGELEFAVQDRAPKLAAAVHGDEESCSCTLLKLLLGGLLSVVLGCQFFRLP